MTNTGRPAGRTTAVATVLVAAAVALFTSSTMWAGSVDGAGPAAPPAAVTAARAPAPPQSFAQPAGEDEQALVPQSAPKLLEAPSIALRAAVTPYTPAEAAANGGAVTPSTLWAVAWWTGGGTPGTDAENTVYLYGHTWKEPAVFNRVKELEPGAAVHVTTVSGRVHYVVDGSFTVPKTELADHPAVSAAVPGRLVLIGCYRETGLEEHTTRNVVVTAHLERG